MDRLGTPHSLGSCPSPVIRARSYESCLSNTASWCSLTLHTRPHRPSTYTHPARPSTEPTFSRWVPPTWTPSVHPSPLIVVRHPLYVHVATSLPYRKLHRGAPSRCTLARTVRRRTRTLLVPAPNNPFRAGCPPRGPPRCTPFP